MKKILLVFQILLALLSQQSLDLNEAVRLALENNYQYKMILDDLEYSKKNIIQGYLNFSPTLTIDHSYFRLSDFGFQLRQAQVEGFKSFLTTYANNTPGLPQSERDQLLNIANTIPGAFQNGHRTTLSAQWNLFAKGMALKALSERKKRKSILEIEKDEKKLGLVYEVREAYFNMLIAGEMLSINKKRLLTTNTRLEQIERFVEQGMRNQAELMRWQFEKSKIEQSLIESESQEKIAARKLAYLLGKSLDEKFSLVNLTKFKTNQFEDLTNDFIKNINDESLLSIKKQVHELEIAKNNKFYTYGKFLPSVDLNWRKTWQESESAANGAQSWELTLNFSWEIFSSFKDFIELQKEEVLIHKNEMALIDLKKQIRLNLYTLFSKFEAAKKQTDATNKSVLYADENFRIAKNRYESGLITNLELLDTEIQSHQSKIDRLNAYKNYILSGYSIKKLIGKY